MKKIIIVIQVSLMLASFNSYSQDSEKPVLAKALIEGGIEYGGDEILTVFFTNGGDQTMLAGQGGYLSFGGQLEFSKVKYFLLRATLGIKYNTTAADNANIRLTRIPINLIPYLLIKEDFRLGFGITSHQNVRFNGDGFVNDIEFSSSIGPRIEFGYKWIALTYTSLKYKAEMEEISASSLGVSISYAFPNK